MNQVHCFTSFNFNYLAKARVLGATVKHHHPDWVMHACICDHEPEGFVFDLEKEPFDRVTWAEDLDIPNLNAWIFGHDVVELCTAVKGTMLRMMLEEGAGKVVYLDPDIAVLGSLDPVAALLDYHDIVLTPHQVDPESHRVAIIDNEICSLKHGTYNLGFVAVANRAEGLRFAQWWEERLLGWCHEDYHKGIFVDQKWCDLAPGFFGSLHILRDPGYNVASWNISKRRVTAELDGRVLVNGSPIRFFHITKFGPVGDTMTQRYARDNTEVYELWAWYRLKIHRYEEPKIPKGWWAYGNYANGERIQRKDRLRYRAQIGLKRLYPNPFDNTEADSYFEWCKANP